MIKIRGDVDHVSFKAALEQLGDPEVWEDDALWQRVAASLPNYRLSKFQPLMRPWVEREMVAAFLLDVGGAWRWVSGGGCWRELGIELDKTEQTSNWARRPLSRRQLAYAALDVEVLPPLWDQLQLQGRLL